MIEVSNWVILIKERFNPIVYLPMILAFVVSIWLFASKAMSLEASFANLMIILLIACSAFFRLRLFDEIKDYEIDLKINPSRPLARGVLTTSQVKIGILILITFELCLALFLSLPVFLIHGFCVFYSLLMYEEFFIGDLLRPHLTTYAITHTLVSSLLGFSVLMMSISPHISPSAMPQMPQWMITFSLSHWFYFNLFEFARKTFAETEERPGVPSYSNIFSPWGAWGLTVSQVAFGLGLLHLTQRALKEDHQTEVSFLILYAMGLIYVLMSLIYPLKKTPLAAKIFRSASEAYLLFHYIGLVFVVWSTS